MDISAIYDSLPARSFWFGIISAVSLPIGAVLGILFTPPKRVVAAIMAFGAGSLLAALTLELVTPAFEKAGFYPLAAGAVTGGLLFVLLNQILNGKGAFLRKPATVMRHLIKSKKARMGELIEHLSGVDLIRALPPGEIQALLPCISSKTMAEGSIVFNQGDPGNALYLVEKGKLDVIQDGAVIASLRDGDSFGEMALLSGDARNATVITQSEVKCWQILKEDFEELIKISPGLKSAVHELNLERLEENLDRESWGRKVKKQAGNIPVSITSRDISEAAGSHHAGTAAMAIWLGIMLDGIPESAVIGASMLHTTVSWALIAGLFLSNLPEAMSSAVGMRQQKASVSKIMWMWISLMLLTGLGALLGNIFFAGASHSAFAVFEGIAAGAMLVMIAETMLPEAYEQGGAVVGIATLVGFLACLFIKSLG